MIKDFKHKGLELFFETGKVNGIQPIHASRLRMQLGALDSAQDIKDLNIPGYRLHKLKGTKNSLWSITVNKNWRLTFEFIGKDVFILNYEDYH
jgi:toxin HigB-1